MEWACGVTTCLSRESTCLTPTLDSLARGGFASPMIYRDTMSNAFGNWVTALNDLTLRFPRADRYVIFQDDVVCSKNLREYLERCHYPERGYWNLITYPGNGEHAPRPDYVGWYRAARSGKGAQGLVFDRSTATALLTSEMFFMRRFDTSLDGRNREKRTRCIDGGVVECLRSMGILEHVHMPSLLNHRTEEPSALNNPRQPEIVHWRGEDFDCMSLLT